MTRIFHFQCPRVNVRPGLISLQFQVARSLACQWGLPVFSSGRGTSYPSHSGTPDVYLETLKVKYPSHPGAACPNFFWNREGLEG